MTKNVFRLCGDFLLLIDREITNEGFRRTVLSGGKAWNQFAQWRNDDGVVVTVKILITQGVRADERQVS